MKKNSIYTIGSLVILLLCAFVFVILPAFTGSSENQSKIPAFGKYNGKSIRYEQDSDMANAVAYYGQMYQNYGQQIDSSAYYYIFSSAFNSTVLGYAYNDFVEKSGYKVPETAVTRQLIPYFSENGKYSSKLYKSTPAEQIRELKSNVEKGLFAGRFEDDNFGSDSDVVGSDALYGLKTSPAELDFLSSYGKDLRGFKLAVFPLADYPESEKIAFGKANSGKFVKYDVSVITVEDKATATSVAKRIANSEITFEDAVHEYSNKTLSNSEGKLTNSYKYQIETLLVTPDTDLAKIDSLSAGSISEVIATGSSFSIFKADSEKILPDFSADTMISQVTSYITTYENSVIEDYFTSKAKDFISEAKSSSFDSAAAKLKVTKNDVAPFPLNYGHISVADSIDSSVEALSGADSNEAFLKAAFSLKLNEVSEPILLNKNIVVLQYTKADKTADDADISVPSLDSFDKASAQTAILSSDKFENNFIEVYFKNFMNN